MTELWSGCIDTRFDLLMTSDTRYASYMFSGRRVRGEDEQQRRESSAPERVILRDRGHLIFACTGTRLRVVLRPVANQKFKTFQVVALVSIRWPNDVTRDMIARSLSNAFALYRASEEQRQAPDDAQPPTAVRTPLTRDAPAYVSELAARATHELAILCKREHRLRPTVIRSLEPYFTTRHLFFAASIARLATLIKTRVVNLSARNIMHLSLSQLTAFVGLALSMSASELLFAGAQRGVMEPYLRTGTLAEPLSVNYAACEPSSLLHNVTLTEFRRRASKAQIKKLDKQLQKRLDYEEPVSDACVESATIAHADACAAITSGRTAFVSRAETMLDELDVWRRLSYDGHLYTTPYLNSRAKLLVGTIALFHKPRCVVVDGGVQFLSDRALRRLWLTTRRPLLVKPSSTCEYEAIGSAATAFSVAEVCAARDVDVRIAAAMSSTLVLLDAHCLTEQSMLCVLSAYMRLRKLAQPYERRSRRMCLVLIGDVNRASRGGWASGSPFADLVACRQLPVEYVDCDVNVPCTQVAYFASYAHDRMAAGRLASLLMAQRRDAADISSILLSSAQFILWASSVAASNTLFTQLSNVLQRAGGKRGRDSNNGRLADQTSWRLASEALAKLVQMPWLMRTHVFVLSPYVFYSGVCHEIAAFLLLIVAPTRDESIDQHLHCKPATPWFGLMSLDCDGLVLLLEHTIIDHRMCCNTTEPRLMRVARHRRELEAASFVLGRDAARQQTLAQSVAVLSLSGEDRSLCWNDTAAALVDSAPDMSVSFVALGATDDDALWCELMCIFRRLWTKRETALDYALVRPTQTAVAPANNDDDDDGSASV